MPGDPERDLAEWVEELVRAVSAEPLPGGYRLLDWDLDQGISLAFDRRGESLLVELSARDDQMGAWSRTNRFNLVARDPFRDGGLGAESVGFLRELTRRLAEHEGRLPAVSRQAAASARTQIRSISATRALVREGRGQYYLNPYVGCTIGCSFCFVGDQADLARSLGGLPKLPWGRWVDVKTNLPEVLAREVRELEPGIVRMSPIVTDPYQPLERRHRITRRCLEVLAGAGFSPCVLTRAARITEDIPTLQRFANAWVGLSIPTDDDRVRHAFEPGADPIDTRLDALAACQRAGLDTFAVVQPILPQDPERLVERLAPLVRVVRIDRLHVGERVGSIYERLGLAHASEDAWFDEMTERLRAGFSRRGVALHALDDLGELAAFSRRAHAG